MIKITAKDGLYYSIDTEFTIDYINIEYFINTIKERTKDDAFMKIISKPNVIQDAKEINQSLYKAILAAMWGNQTT